MKVNRLIDNMLKRTPPIMILLMFVLSIIFILSIAKADKSEGNTPLNLTVNPCSIFSTESTCQLYGCHWCFGLCQLKSCVIVLDVTPEILTLVEGSASSFEIFFGRRGGTTIDDATVNGTMHLPNGTTDILNFSLVTGGTYRTDLYTFTVVGPNVLEIEVFSSVGNYTMNVTTEVSAGIIGALFPSGFVITPQPTLNFTLIPEEFLVLMEDKQDFINLTVINNEDFNIIVMIDTRLKGIEEGKTHYEIIPPLSEKTFKFKIKVREFCAERNWVISLYVRAGLEITKAQINRVDVPIDVFTICPDGTFPNKVLRLIREAEEAEKRGKIEREKLRFERIFLIIFVVGFAISGGIVFYKYESVKKYLKRLTSLKKKGGKCLYI